MVVEYKGKKYSSVAELLKTYNVLKSIYYKRLKSGATLEEALEAKSHGA